jgi:hypothetical protein
LEPPSLPGWRERKEIEQQLEKMAEARKGKKKDVGLKYEKKKAIIRNNPDNPRRLR